VRDVVLLLLVVTTALEATLLSATAVSHLSDILSKSFQLNRVQTQLLPVDDEVFDDITTANDCFGFGTQCNDAGGGELSQNATSPSSIQCLEAQTICLKTLFFFKIPEK
jgi:hypothetical protein